MIFRTSVQRLLPIITLAIGFVTPVGAADVTAEQVVAHYARMGHAVYADSLAGARELDRAVDAFLDDPSPARLAIARETWKAARIPYGQSEIYRFGNPPVDAWEGKVNAWPLDEGLIDYVVGPSDYEYSQGNEAAEADVIANQKLQVYGRTIDASVIDMDLLRSLHEIGGSEANVSTGYHAIEFLLWGRDNNVEPTDTGQRPVTDYAVGRECTSGSDNSAAAHVCRRRGRYLRVVTDLLVSDLEEMVAEWAPKRPDNYREKLQSLKPKEGVRRIMRGMSAMAGGELSNERMRVALIAHGQEDEHSCFSDNTHVDIMENARGIANAYHGRYRRSNGVVLSGPSVEDLVRAESPELADRLSKSLARTLKSAHALEVAALTGEHFDQLIRVGNSDGARRIGATIDALGDDTQLTVKAAHKVGIEDLNKPL